MRSAVLLLLLTPAFAQAPDPQQLFREAVEAQRRGDDDAAIAKYQELVKLAPDVIEVRGNLGAVLAHKGRFDEAIEQYHAALIRSPNNPGLQLNLALAFYKKGDWANAIGRLEPLHEAHADDVRLSTLLGDSYAHQGQAQKAVDLLLPLESSHADDLSLESVLGMALGAAGHPHEGVERLEKAAQAGKDAEGYLAGGRMALRSGEFERAARDADSALALKPSLAGAYTLKGQALQYISDYPGAIDALTKAIAQNAADYDAQITFGAVLSKQRDIEKALPHLEAALKLRPDSTLARYEIAKIQRTHGEIDDALKNYELVVKEEPKWLQPHVELAALYYKLNRPQDGERERKLVDQLTAEQQSKGVEK